ncbi:HNH endonuclease family protein [Staphylospora marina]|uniref:HNH endonuclease family protein n=1 Tax=Staphylospora marina TaxID=2490858 RepID=UPI000F5BFB52|nr:HNH endonuclease family protein [Staphylospora marina]
MVHKPLMMSLALMLALSLSIVYPTESAFALPSTPSLASAQAELNALKVEPEGSMSGYSRDKFPHWTNQGGGCNTRQVVLKRDADYYSGNCPVTSGKWYSYYDGVVVYSPSEVDIDHIVPLAEAWRSGASSWSQSKRQAFANDLSGPQLIAVTSSVNRSKGDQDPSTWQPPRTGARCAYAKWWIRTKYNWGLSVQASEKSALQAMLNTCSY